MYTQFWLEEARKRQREGARETFLTLWVVAWRGVGAMSAGPEERVRQVGDLVWAKMDGFPIWPAQVFPRELCDDFGFDKRDVDKEFAETQMEFNAQGKGRVFMVLFFGDNSYDLYGTKDERVKTFELDEADLQRRKESVVDDYEDPDVAGSYCKALCEIQHVAMRRGGANEYQISEAFTFSELEDIQANTPYEVRNNLHKIAEVRSRSTRQLEKLNKLEGTSEPFASALWEYWKMDGGPGKLDRKVLKCNHKLGGEHVDLGTLFTEVNIRGGYEEVTKNKLWSQVGTVSAKKLHNANNLSTYTKRIYEYSLRELETYLRGGGKVENIDLPEYTLKGQTHKRPKEKKQVTLALFNKEKVHKHLRRLRLIAVYPKLRRNENYDEGLDVEKLVSSIKPNDGLMMNLKRSLEKGYLKLPLLEDGHMAEDGAVQVSATSEVDVQYRCASGKKRLSPKNVNGPLSKRLKTSGVTKTKAASLQGLTEKSAREKKRTVMAAPSTSRRDKDDDPDFSPKTRSSSDLPAAKKARKKVVVEKKVKQEEEDPEKKRLKEELARLKEEVKSYEKQTSMKTVRFAEATTSNGTNKANGTTAAAPAASRPSPAGIEAYDPKCKTVEIIFTEGHGAPSEAKLKAYAEIKNLRLVNVTRQSEGGDDKCLLDFESAKDAQTCAQNLEKGAFSIPARAMKVMTMKTVAVKKTFSAAGRRNFHNSRPSADPKSGDRKSSFAKGSSETLARPPSAPNGGAKPQLNPLQGSMGATAPAGAGASTSSAAAGAGASSSSASPKGLLDFLRSKSKNPVPQTTLTLIEEVQMKKGQGRLSEPDNKLFDLIEEIAKLIQ